MRSCVAAKRDPFVQSIIDLGQLQGGLNGMTENEIAKQMLDAAFLVHTKLGPSLLESVYEVVVAYELKKR